MTSSNGVAQYDVGTGGLLSPKSPASVAAGSGPVSVAVSPDGRSVYVGNAFSMTISQYDVRAGGALSPKTPAAVPAGGLPAGVAVAPDGKSVYAAHFDLAADNPNGVSQYNVDRSGRLSFKDPEEVVAGGGPSAGLAVSPDRKSVYVANSGSDTVSQYDVGAGGALSPKRVDAVGTGDEPSGVAVTPDGRSVYVANFGDPTSGGGSVSQYDVCSMCAEASATKSTAATVAMWSRRMGATVCAAASDPCVSGARARAAVSAGAGS